MRSRWRLQARPGDDEHGYRTCVVCGNKFEAAEYRTLACWRQGCQRALKSGRDRLSKALRRADEEGR